MRAKPAYFIFLFISALGFYSQAQDNTHDKKQIDSLAKALSLAEHDTDGIKLRCLIGEYAKIPRTSYWDSILSDARKYNMPLYECRALVGLSHAYQMQHNDTKAMEYLNSAISIAESKNYKTGIVPMLKDLLGLCTGKADKRSLELCYRGLKIADKLNEKRVVVDFYSTIGTYYFFIGNIPKALEVHFKCLKICRELNYHLGIAGALADIGADYHAQNNIKKTFEYYLASGQYAGEFSKNIYGAYIYNSVASAYQLMDQYDSAYKYSYKSYKISESLNSKRGMASATAVIAAVLLEKGKNREAENLLLEAIDMAKSSDFMVQVPDLASILKNVYLKNKDYKKAFEAYQLQVETKDRISNEKNRKLALQKDFDYNLEKKEQQYKLLAQENKIQSLETRYILIGLGSLLLIVLVIGYLFLRQKRAEAEQQSVQLEQKLIRAQMNPHFIFNSLNSIQQFIISRQNDLAELYLSKFAKLVRELLESNIKENISVKDEAAILLGYIEMESLRFRKSFSFLVTVDEKIDQERSHIPHMMIQPFIENAIWHGLLAKEGERNLLVTLESDTKKTIRCVVDDNGVGREKSMKAETMFKKRSLALSFVKQRIVLLRKTLKVNCSVEIIDKKDAGGNSTGTKVIVVLPIMNK